MIGQFIIQNKTTKKEISLGQDSSYEYLIPEGGIDWGKVQATHSTFSYPGQAGVHISSTSLRARDITITGYIAYVLSDIEKSIVTPSEQKEYCYNKILEKKSILDAVCNPHDYVRILIGDYYIEGKPSSSVIYGKTDRENNNFFCKFTMSIYCNQPMFKRLLGEISNLSGVTPALHFPLVLSHKGIIMSIRRNYQLLAIENDGALEVGAIFKLRAKAEVVNPKIENVFTGEHILISKTLQENEVVTINTNDGEDKGIFGYLENSQENYFKYWSFSNSWIKFPVGISLIGYSVESDNEALLEVTIELNPVRYTLEEM